jgi:hypothetical protein
MPSIRRAADADDRAGDDGQGSDQQGAGLGKPRHRAREQITFFTGAGGGRASRRGGQDGVALDRSPTACGSPFRSGRADLRAGFAQVFGGSSRGVTPTATVINWQVVAYLYELSGILLCYT